jgi:uncharacterized membrane protein
MAQTDFADFEAKSPGDRTVMHVLYGLHTLAWFSAGAFAIVAVILNYIKRGDEHEPMYVMHHNYMISTFWWTLLWLVVAAPLWLVLFVPGLLAYFVIWLWYLYRCVRGWMRFADGKPPR